MFTIVAGIVWQIVQEFQPPAWVTNDDDDDGANDNDDHDVDG